jgi:hypothetical protein
LAVTGGRARSSSRSSSTPSYDAPPATDDSSSDTSDASEDDDDDGDDSGSDEGGVTNDEAKPREEVNKILPPDALADSLVKLAGDSAVYYIGLDGKRHPFPNSATFRSWYADFSEVRPVSADTLASIPLGAPIMVRPGTHWVKIVSDPKTYYVEPGYKLRWIRDEDTARLLGGPDWNRNIVDVDPSLFTVYTMGADIDSATLAAGWPAGALVKAAGAPEVYYVTSTGRRSFANEAAMHANHFQMRFVVTTGMTAGWVSRAIEPVIMGIEDALFSLMH